MILFLSIRTQPSNINEGIQNQIMYQMYQGMRRVQCLISDIQKVTILQVNRSDQDKTISKLFSYRDCEYNIAELMDSWASLVPQMVKNPPAIWETWVRSLGWKDPLEKGMVTAVFWPGEFHGLYSP